MCENEREQRFEKDSLGCALAKQQYQYSVEECEQVAKRVFNYLTESSGTIWIPLE